MKIGRSATKRCGIPHGSHAGAGEKDSGRDSCNHAIRPAVTKKLRVGIIGAGWPGQQHARALNALQGVELYACAEAIAGRAAPLNSAEQALYLMEMLDAIYLSSSTGREVPIARAEKSTR